MRLFHLLLILLLCLWGSRAIGSHIVGGEIVLEHLQGFSYRIKVNIYRDAVGILPPSSARIGVYERGTGGLNPNLIQTFIVPKIFDSIVPALTPGCQNSIITVERWYYQDSIFLDPQVYNDPSGYLFTWQSCCRNANITNIQNPSGTGQTMLTLFPPVADPLGNQIINSTPQLFPPISEYACVGQLFYVDFGGTDQDGDSLAYEMFTPRDNGGLGGGTTTPPHAPFADPLTMIGGVSWSPGYSADDAIKGFSGPPDPAPDRLQVDENAGQVQVVPRIPGNQLFGVWCKEYRDIDGNGSKELIGSVYRDYQMPVVNGCTVPDTLDGPVPQTASISPGDTFQVPGIISQRQVCFKIWDKDYDPLDPVGRNATFEVDPVNFSSQAISFNPSSHTFSGPNDTVNFCIDFEGCVSSGNEPFKLKIVTKKGSCPLPYPDSSLWYFDVQSIPYFPAISYPGNVSYDPALYRFPAFNPVTNPDTFMTFKIKPGWTIEFDLLTVDSAYDTLIQYIEGVGFDSKQVGMQFFNNTEVDTLNGMDSLLSTFRWTPDCFFTDSGYGHFNIVTVDKFCFDPTNIRPVYFEILITDSLPETSPIAINLDTPNYKFHNYDPITRPDTFVTFALKPNTEVKIDFLTKNLTTDSIFQYLEGDGFDARNVGMRLFSSNQFDTIWGLDTITAEFRWTPRCHFFDTGGGKLYLVTAKPCYGIINKRPIFFKINKENAIPNTRVRNVIFDPSKYDLPPYDPYIKGDTFLTFSIYPKETFEVEFVTTDSTFDTLYQYIEGIGFDPDTVGMQYFNATGNGILKGKDSLNATFKWTAECNFFNQGFGDFYIVTRDKNCQEPIHKRLCHFEILKDNAFPNIVLSQIAYDSSLFKSFAYHPTHNPDTFLVFEINPNTKIEFEITTSDTTGDSLFQFIEGIGFDAVQAGMNFFDNSGSYPLSGVGNMVSNFEWTPGCYFRDTLYHQFNIITVDKYCQQKTSIQPVFFKMSFEDPFAKVEPFAMDFSPRFYEFPPYDPYTSPDTFLIFQIRPNWTIDLELLTTDNSTDTIIQFIEGVDYNYKDLGMRFFNEFHQDTIRGVGSIRSRFVWKPDCKFFSQGKGRINLVTYDISCGTQLHVRPIYFEIIKDNEPPYIVGEVGTSPDRTESEVLPRDQIFRKRVGESLVFDYKTIDPDGDKVFLYYSYEGRSEYQTKILLYELGIGIGNQFNEYGDSTLISTFSWHSRKLDCEMYERFGKGTPFQIKVIAIDSSCLMEVDSTILTIEIHDGTNPYFEFRDEAGELLEIQENKVQMSFEKQDISFSVIARDDDVTQKEPGRTEFDEIRMQINPDGFSFEEQGFDLSPKPLPFYVEKYDSVNIFWEPACEERNSEPLQIIFSVKDKSCEALGDSLFVELEATTEYIFPNMITANGDGLNDYLEIEDPTQRCGFVRIQIFNRWGSLVFSSNDPAFQFDGKDLPPGDYFYSVSFENRTFTQNLKILK